MDIIGLLFNNLRIILGLILVLFLPGFALSWALYPEKEDLTMITRIALSSVLSISSVMISVIFLDMVIGIDSTPQNIVIIIFLTTAVALLVWKLELIFSHGKIQERFFLRTRQWAGNLKDRIIRVSGKIKNLGHNRE